MFLIIGNGTSVLSQRFFYSMFLLSLLALTGCQNLSLSSAVQSDVQAVAPYGLTDAASSSDEKRPSGWIDEFGDPALLSLIEQSVDQNFDLGVARYRVEAARQQRISSRSSLLPSASLGTDASRSKSNRPASVFSENYSADFSLNWEADLWGKNYASFKAQDLLLQAEQATAEASRLSIAGQVAKTWYQLVTSQLLTELFSKRVENLRTNLEIINSGYRQGLSNALDVYLARTNVSNELINLEAQKEQNRDITRQLQLLLGEYPTGNIVDLEVASSGLPNVPDIDGVTISTDVVRHRFDLQASFLVLAAQDRQLAAAHRARFPSLNIVASIGDSAGEVSQLFDGQSLAWNVVGGLTQPVFSGGRLKAQEDQQLAVLRQSELQYLQSLNIAFSEIEQALTNDQALNQQLVYLEEAIIDAEAGEELAFDQYRRGLVSYIEVLEAQRRAFIAQTSQLNLRNQYLQNRINMYLALGADYLTPTQPEVDYGS